MRRRLGKFGKRFLSIIRVKFRKKEYFGRMLGIL